jgi:hypothetical protein
MVELDMRWWGFWILAPVFLLTGLGLPFIVHPPTCQGQVVLHVFCGGLLLATVAFAAPKRCPWALRGVAGLVFLAFSAYLAEEAVGWCHGKPFGFDGRRSDHNLFNALRGWFFLGLPCLVVLLSPKRPPSPDVAPPEPPED